jgi:hypothetical protein
MIHLSVAGIPYPVPQFTASSLMAPDHFGAQWTFTASMVSTCEPVLDDCDDNHAVADRLKRASVIDSDCEEDSEMCQLFVYFKSQSAAEGFLSRLNAYLLEKARRIHAAANF